MALKCWMEMLKMEEKGDYATITINGMHVHKHNIIQILFESFNLPLKAARRQKSEEKKDMLIRINLNR